MKVHPSALKHGVAAEDAIQAAEWPLWIEPLDDDGPPERELRLEFDTNARLLETVVLVFAGGDETVIHAMPARKQYLDLLPQPGRLRGKAAQAQPQTRSSSGLARAQRRVLWPTFASTWSTSRLETARHETQPAGSVGSLWG